MARKRKTKKDEDEGALSPRTVLVALLIAAIAAGAAHLLKHPAIVEEWAEASANLNATARARRRDSELMKLVPSKPHDKSAFDRAVAWCARNWDDESKRVARMTCVTSSLGSWPALTNSARSRPSFCNVSPSPPLARASNGRSTASATLLMAVNSDDVVVCFDDEQ